MDSSSARVATGKWFPILISSATLLLVGQILVGTSIYFACTVYITLVVVLVTLRLIGLSTIAGILIAYLAFRYLVVSQIVKTLLGQPGDSNLGAPDTTITILLIGICSLCAAALLVRLLMGERKFISVSPSPEVLAHVRNISFGFGGLFLLVIVVTGTTQSAAGEVGGIRAVASQFANIIFLAVLAETWRVLTISQGKRSISSMLLTMLCLLTIMGFVFNSKKGMADALLMYLIASASYRRHLTRAQVGVVICAFIGGITIAYPSVQMLRSQRGTSSVVSFQLAEDFFYRVLTEPQSVVAEWESLESTPDLSLYAEGIKYLGSHDALLERFMLIANTDVIVAAVNQDGPYGMKLVTMGLDMMLPTFLDPDKPRDDTGDVLAWHYGLREWGLFGYPTVGMFADSYAALKWAGVTIFPFFIGLIFFIEIQIPGRWIRGNFIGAYFVFEHFHLFGENTIAALDATIIRNVPTDYIFIFAMFYVADLLIDHRLRRAKEALRLAGPDAE